MKRCRRFLAVVAVLVVGLCIAGYRAVQVSAGPVGGTAAVAGPAIGSGSAELGELRQELFRLRRQVYAQGQRLAADPARAQPEPAEPPGPEARAEAERKHKD